MESIRAIFSYGKATIHMEGPAEAIQSCLESGSISRHLMGAAAATSATPDDLDDETFDRSLAHAWGWFSLHADHRMKSVNFFIVTIAFLTAAYVTALRFSLPLAGAGVSVAGLLLTICFSRFELRIRELIKASEAALKPLQDRLAKQTKIDAFRMFELVEGGKKPFTRYSHVILALHIIAGTMFILGAIFALKLHYC